jgi:hypothetical protein
MTRITVTLTNNEKAALILLATQESRDPRFQATLIIRRELERRGLLLREQTGNPNFYSQPVTSKPVN